MSKLIKQAFTLIELLVVIAIIGILSGLIVVSMSGVNQKATIAKAQVFSNSLRNSLLLNIVSEWRFDGTTADGSVATVNDVLNTWSNVNNGTVAFPPTVKTNSSCVSGSCLLFSGAAASGSYNYVDFGTNSSLSVGLGDATVSLWVKFDNATAPMNETMINCGASAATIGSDGYWIFRYNGTNRLYVRFMDGETAAYAQGYLSAVDSLVADTWYNIVVVFTRASTAQAYINGANTGASFSITAQQGSVVNSLGYKIGSYSSSAHRLAGLMDDIRLYNAAMPTSQIKEQYYAGLNSLLSSGQITEKEYSERINSIAKQ